MKRVLVVGGGYAGLTVARRLLAARDVEVTVLNPHGYMTYQPLLPETAAGTVQPAHVVVPLRSALPGARVLTAALTGLDTERRVATATAADGAVHRIAYDEVVLAVGSVTRTLPVPGLVEHAIGFRTVEEALHLGSRVLHALDRAASTDDPGAQRRARTFVFAGAGYAGIEALAELEDMVRRTHPADRPHTRWVLVEAADRILAQLPDRLAAYVHSRLTRRGVEVLTNTRIASIGADHVRLSDGSVIETETVVWTAGVVASPVLRQVGLPVDPQGRVVADAHLRVRDGVWALGDCAAVPDVHTGGLCPPTAQHAVRQAVRVAQNILAQLRGRRLREYRHRDAGAVASLGLRTGVAELYGVPLRGYPAWLVHRLYHGTRLPCPRRRTLVLLIWLLGARNHDPVALHALEQPRGPLQEAHAQQAR